MSICVSGKALMGLFKLSAKLAIFLMKHHFCLRLWLTNFSCTEYFLDVLHKEGLSVKGKLTLVDKIWIFKKKLKFRKICISYHEIQGFPILKDIPNETVGYVNECDFFYIIIKGVNIWKTCIVEWTNIFRITHRW